jgi:RimJ/RimL family protein N-acetyltransferase
MADKPITDDRITAARIALTPLAVADAEEMTAVLSGTELYKFIGGHPPTLDELRATYARQVSLRSPDGHQEWRNWIIRLDPAGTAVGYLQATIADLGTRAEIAWVVGVDWQGQGYAVEAAQALVGWLDARCVDIIQAHIHPGHDTSAAVAQRAGLRPTGRFDDGEQLWLRHRPGRDTRAGSAPIAADP